MQAQESSTEASRECRSRFSDTAFCTCQLSSETRQEVVLSLFRVQDRYRRQYTEGISRQEDYLMSVRTFGYRLNDVVDVIDRIRNTSVFSSALICEVDLTVGINCYVLQQSVTFDSIVDIGFAVFVQVDNLSIATAFVVEYAFVVPTMFVVTDQQTFRVGRQSSLTCTGQTEEDSRVSAFHVGVGRTVHRSDAAKRVLVVHDREHTFLHFTTIPSVQDNLLVGFQVEYSSCFRVQTQFLVVVNFCFGSVE